MTSTTQQWRAIATFEGVELTDDQRETLTRALGGFAELNEVGERLHVKWTMTTPTIRTAADTALRALRQAYIVTFRQQRDPLALRVVDIDEYDREIATPDPAELVGWREIAEILEVSPQRAQQLESRPDFPAPLARLAAGPVFTRDSVITFNAGWERRPGRPRKAG